jgi:hypothetical protein
MDTFVVCANTRCKTRWVPTAKQQAFIDQSARKGMAFVMLECPECAMAAHVQLQAPEHSHRPLPASLRPLRCPVETCSGWAVKVDDCWGCGECGIVWSDRKTLDQAITAVIQKHPYRAACYIQKRTGWIAVPMGQEPAGYKEQVSTEWSLQPARTACKTAQTTTSKAPAKTLKKHAKKA